MTHHLTIGIIDGGAFRLHDHRPATMAKVGPLTEMLLQNALTCPFSVFAYFRVALIACLLLESVCAGGQKKNDHTEHAECGPEVFHRIHHFARLFSCSVFSVFVSTVFERFSFSPISSVYQLSVEHVPGCFRSSRILLAWGRGPKIKNKINKTKSYLINTVYNAL